jgi:hypothetical protein
MISNAIKIERELSGLSRFKWIFCGFIRFDLLNPHSISGRFRIADA